jgi:hypothetical protein
MSMHQDALAEVERRRQQELIEFARQGGAVKMRHYVNPGHRLEWANNRQGPILKMCDGEMVMVDFGDGQIITVSLSDLIPSSGEQTPLPA